MARAIVAILAIVLLVGVSIFAYQAAIAEAGEDTVVTNESWTPTAGSVTQLDNSNQEGAYYGNDTTVFDSTDSLMDRGADYRWFADNGTVKAVAGGDLDGESSATISYTYQQTTAEQRGLFNLATQMPNVLAALIPLLGVALLLKFLTG